MSKRGICPVNDFLKIISVTFSIATKNHSTNWDIFAQPDFISQINPTKIWIQELKMNRMLQPKKFTVVYSNNNNNDSDKHTNKIKKHRISTISPPPTSVEVQTNRKETSTTTRKQKATATEPFFALHPPHSNFIMLRSTRWRCTSHSDWKCRINATAWCHSYSIQIRPVLFQWNFDFNVWPEWNIFFLFDFFSSVFF